MKFIKDNFCYLICLEDFKGNYLGLKRLREKFRIKKKLLPFTSPTFYYDLLL